MDRNCSEGRLFLCYGKGARSRWEQEAKVFTVEEQECFFEFVHILVLARTGLILVIARTGLARTQRLFYTTSRHCQGGRKGVSSREKEFLLVKWAWQEGAVQSCLLLGVFHVNPSFPVPSVISIVAVIICFLISLLSAVNCSYLYLWCLQFSSAAGEWPGGEWVSGAQALVGILNWDIPFLNHDR